MENAIFHNSGETRRVITEKDGHVWYLPPDSPDLNPIEPPWALLKR